jgi:hypothetical protein
VRNYILLAVLLLSSLWAGVAEARHVHFAGPHPIAAKYGGGYCYIETPHLHIYPPDHAALYQQVNDEYVFTGDPTPFGYDGEKYPYYGHHPVVSVNGEPLYCYIDGPHFHAVPPPSDGYKMKNGVAFYVGPFAPAYGALKPHRAKLMNAEYRPYATFRPTVEVQPPPEWHGEVYAPGVVVTGPGVAVDAPGVVVTAPGVEVTAPGVVVRGPGVVVPPPLPVIVPPPPPGVHVRGGVVVGPPVPRPGVVVVGPAPPRPGVVVVEHHDVFVEHREHEHREHEHHDNGKHKGWFK